MLLVVGGRLLLVVLLLLGEGFLSEFFLAFVDVAVKFVAVFADGELLVIVDRDVNLPSANWFVFWVVELSNVFVL